MVSTILSPTQPKRAALLYALKLSLLFLPLLLLAYVALGILFRLVTGVRADYDAYLLALGATFGVTFATYTGYRKLVGRDYEVVSPADRSAYLTLHLTYPQAFERCLSSLSLFDNSRIVVADIANGHIEAVLLPEPFWRTLFRSGTRLSYRLGSAVHGETEVLLTTKLVVTSLTFVPSRRNQANVDLIAGFLEGE